MLLAQIVTGSGTLFLPELFWCQKDFHCLSLCLDEELPVVDSSIFIFST